MEEEPPKIVKESVAATAIAHFAGKKFQGLVWKNQRMNEPNEDAGLSHRRKRPHKRNPETVKRKNKERKARRRKLEKEFNVAEEELKVEQSPGLVAQVGESEERIEENEAEKAKEGNERHGSNKKLTTKAMFKVRTLLFLCKTSY